MESHLICNNCGGRYQTIYTDSPDDTTTFPDKKSVGIGTKNKVEKKSYRYQCPVCGAVKPKVSYNEENELTYRAFQLLADAKFDKASKAFDAVLAKYPENVEAYWGKVKVRYRVLYKENAKGKMLPTCEKTKQGSVFKDENYKKAFQYADERIQKFLKKQANEIDRILGIKAKQAAVVALASCMIIGAGSFGAYQIFRHRHTWATEPTLAPTCTETGLSEKTYCEECGEILQNSTPIDALGHTLGAEANCTEAQFCTVCGEELTPSLGGHTPGAEATCTESQVCTVCGEELNPMIEHTFAWVTVIPSTATEEGLRAYQCTVCGTKTETESIPVRVASEGLAYTVNADKSTCTITGIGTCKDTELCIPAMIDSYRVTGIGDDAFLDCTKLTSVSIPRGVTSIGEHAFRYCSSVVNFEIPDTVLTIGNGAFTYCNNLERIYIPKSVELIDYLAFTLCENLESITVDPDNSYYKSIDGNLYTKDGTSLICYANGKDEICFEIPIGATTIQSYAIRESKTLERIVMPIGMQELGHGCINDCPNLKTVEFSKTVRSVGFEVFLGCLSLQNIIVDSENPYYQSIDGNLYSKDGTTMVQYGIGKKDEVFTIPDGVDYIDNAFWGADHVKEIIIPYGVTHFGYYAFCGCDNLTSIAIPDSVISISGCGLRWCGKLTEIRYSGTTAQWQNITKESGWDTSTGEYTIICTDGTITKNGTVTPN